MKERGWKTDMETSFDFQMQEIWLPWPGLCLLFSQYITSKNKNTLYYATLYILNILYLFQLFNKYVVSIVLDARREVNI